MATTRRAACSEMNASTVPTIAPEGDMRGSVASRLLSVPKEPSGGSGPSDPL